MAQVIPADFIHELHGKMSSASNGYFYMSKKTGKMYFRSREEGYQKNQSSRQKWNSSAFAYAHKQLPIPNEQHKWRSITKPLITKPPMENHTPPPMLGSSILCFGNGNKHIQ